MRKFETTMVLTFLVLMACVTVNTFKGLSTVKPSILKIMNNSAQVSIISRR